MASLTHSAAMDIPKMRVGVSATQTTQSRPATQADSYCFYSTSPTAVAFYDFDLRQGRNALSGSGYSAAPGSGSGFFARLFGSGTSSS
ncbi:hypothetical protein HYH03_008003 [Edaphochlamys debaryana]|uniref:Uncharacterized protein n=1 Tax=Edaphochlamys debaryana TaxID=47281 RepID=A0A836BZV3_9CHLO|nr:hypothetical protein HYH03_008003 [Edaphochlamys debaryana]|eukprot:KAG2493783.1 hypothetical protein HYH03_008003 [Edaphochlamys debaryana]